MNYILYSHNFNINSGGSSLNFMFCEYLQNNLNLNNFYIAPIFCRGDGIIDRNFIKINNLNEDNYDFDIHSRTLFLINDLKDEYFNKENYNWPEKYKKFLITREILNTKNNVAIYGEGFLGNPLQQKYVMRWILYFPTPGLPVDPYFPWSKKDKFVYWAKSYFKNKDFIYAGLNDGQITKTDYYPEENDIFYLKYLFIHDIIDLNYNKNNNTRNGSCFLIRKADINYNRTFGNNWNYGTNYNINHPFMKPKPPKYIHPPDSICIDSYGIKELIEIFKTKKYFYCYDLYTFHNCIALLYGCKVIMCIPNAKMSKEEWHCGEKLYLDYVAWGDSKEQLDKADEKLKNINYGNIINECQNDCLNEFNEAYEKLENYYNNLKDSFFQKTIQNMTFEGKNFEKIDYIIDNNYTSNFNSNFWEINIEFIIYSNNLPYSNLFDMNFNKINFGPRLEYNNGCLGLIIGNLHFFKGIDISNNVNENVLHKLNIKLESHSLLINFNGSLLNKNVFISPNSFENIIIGKGFNDERYFKGFIQNFNLIIY
jgi:hypothetical protein